MVNATGTFAEPAKNAVPALGPTGAVAPIEAGAVGVPTTGGGPAVPESIGPTTIAPTTAVATTEATIASRRRRRACVPRATSASTSGSADMSRACSVRARSDEVLDAHDVPSRNESPNRAPNAARPARACPFTLPGRMPRASAISASLSPS